MSVVLIIDDDQRNIFALKAVLQSRTISVLTATDASQGLQLLECNREIDLVLLDMMMPGMDGYETISVIRASEHFGEIPVIAVTAQAMPGDREKCLAAGANEYLSKPIDVDRLLELMNQFHKTNR